MKEKLKRAAPFLLGGVGLVILLVLLKRQQAAGAEGQERARASTLLGYLAGSFQQVTTALGGGPVPAPASGGSVPTRTPPTPGPVSDPSPLPVQGPFIPVSSPIARIEPVADLPGTNPPVSSQSLSAWDGLWGVEPVDSQRRTSGYVEPVSTYVVRLASGAEVGS